MIRSLIITIAIAATTLGALGLPMYLHTCRMLAETTAEAGCPSCAGMDHDADADMGGDNGCCSSTVVNQRSDSGTLTRVELPSLPVVVAPALHSIYTLEAPSRPLAAFEHNAPPGLAVRAQASYLLNSTFLI